MTMATRKYSDWGPDQIRTEMSYRRLTQQSLASEIGISPTTLSQIMQGKVRITRAVAWAMIGYFGWADGKIDDRP